MSGGVFLQSDGGPSLSFRRSPSQAKKQRRLVSPAHSTPTVKYMFAEETKGEFLQRLSSPKYVLVEETRSPQKNRIAFMSSYVHTPTMFKLDASDRKIRRGRGKKSKVGPLTTKHKESDFSIIKNKNDVIDVNDLSDQTKISGLEPAVRTLKKRNLKSMSLDQLESLIESQNKWLDTFELNIDLEVGIRNTPGAKKTQINEREIPYLSIDDLSRDCCHAQTGEEVSSYVTSEADSKHRKTLMERLCNSPKSQQKPQIHARVGFHNVKHTESTLQSNGIESQTASSKIPGVSMSDEYIVYKNSSRNYSVRLTNGVSEDSGVEDLTKRTLYHCNVQPLRTARTATEAKRIIAADSSEKGPVFVDRGSVGTEKIVSIDSASPAEHELVNTNQVDVIASDPLNKKSINCVVADQHSVELHLEKRSTEIFGEIMDDLETMRRTIDHSKSVAPSCQIRIEKCKERIGNEAVDRLRNSVRNIRKKMLESKAASLRNQNCSNKYFANEPLRIILKNSERNTSKTEKSPSKLPRKFIRRFTKDCLSNEDANEKENLLNFLSKPLCAVSKVAEKRHPFVSQVLTEDPGNTVYIKSLFQFSTLFENL